MFTRQRYLVLLVCLSGLVAASPRRGMSADPETVKWANRNSLKSQTAFKQDWSAGGSQGHRFEKLGLHLMDDTTMVSRFQLLDRGHIRILFYVQEPKHHL